jgi:hypothetical protein
MLRARVLFGPRDGVTLPGTLHSRAVVQVKHARGNDQRAWDGEHSGLVPAVQGLELSASGF